MIQPIRDDSHSKALIPYTGTPTETVYANLAKRILAQSFDAQFKDYTAFHHFGEGEIMVLLGTSTAGKSSIISSLKKIEPERIEQGIDMASCQQLLDYLEFAHHEDYVFLQSVLQPKDNDIHILDAFFGKKFPFKQNISELDQSKARELVDKLTKQIDEDIPFPQMEGKMLDEVISFSVCGKASIFDVLEIENVFRHVLKSNFHAPIKIALVYCPFKLLTERMAERNRKALENNDFLEIRAGPFPLFQFARLFGPKQNDDDLVIETLTREDVEKAFDINFDIEVDLMKKENPEEMAKKDIQKDREVGKNYLLQALGFTDPKIQQVELTPLFKRYDFLIDTSKVKPEESARIIQKPK